MQYVACNILYGGLMDIYEFLDEHGIGYERFDHPAVYTVEEAQRLVPEMPGAETKNLFLRDRKGKRHFLVVVGYDKSVDLKQLAKKIGVSKLGFASPERLMRYLGVEPGSVSLLAIVNDAAAEVEGFVDAGGWAADMLKCHPLVNTASLAIAKEDIAKILEVTGHSYMVVDVPARDVA